MRGETFFFYGTLCHLPLLRAVLGRAPDVRPARLPGHAVHWADGHAFPIIRPDPSAVAEGILAEGLTAGDRARLDHYEGGFDFGTAEVTVAAGDGPVTARMYLPGPRWRPGAAWSLDDWAAAWGEVAVEAAQDVMALMGLRAPAEIVPRYGAMLGRAASRLRARPGAPAALRRRADPCDVAVEAFRQPYAHFFAVEEYDMRFRRFDGGLSAAVNRAVFVSGDAATVLPYDPVRDRVLLIEQFRPGTFARGDSQPWQLEAVAGRVDADERPEATALREAREEAGVTLDRLLPVAAYYPSPAAKTEFIYSFVGLCDLPDRLAGGVGGMPEEHEDIRTHLIPFARLEELIASGEAQNGPLLVSAMWLARERPRLRSEAGIG